jgi:two-component system phosphate regulon sensor histidine kinase PhoR
MKRLSQANLDKMRQDFVANVSHELRTPLTVLRGYLEMFLDKRSPELAPYETIFSQMNLQAVRMEHIIEDLLLLSRLETDLPIAEEWQRISISLLLERIQQDAIALSGDKQHQISIKITGPQFFYAKEAELLSAFSNLVFNAVHYSPPRSSIEMNWYQDKKGIHFAVQDAGMGIEAKHIPRLTERFYRVDPGRTRETGGTGLGLAIVKHVLIRHDAQLHIESTVDKGSLFRCDFPLPKPPKK